MAYKCPETLVNEGLSGIYVLINNFRNEEVENHRMEEDDMLNNVGRIMAIAVLIVFVFTGCSNSFNDKDEIVNSENSEVVEINDVDTEYTTWTELSETELVWFNEQFFNNPENQIVNYFLQSEYSDVKNIDLFKLFYDLPKTSADELTSEEVQLVRAQDDGFELDIQKVPTKYMNEILKTYANVTLEESNKIKLNLFIYLSEYDAYYMSRSDFHYTEYTMVSGQKNSDGSVRLQYENYEVVLATQENGYYFISNLKNE